MQIKSQKSTSNKLPSVPYQIDLEKRHTNWLYAKALIAYNQMSDEDIEELREIQRDWSVCSADGNI